MRKGAIYIEKDKIKVLIIKPKEHPVVEEIENTLDSLKNIVSGHIEAFQIEDAVGIVNGAGKILALEGNRRYGNDILTGNIIITGSDEEGEFISLTNEQIRRFSELFYEPMEIPQEEINHQFPCF